MIAVDYRKILIFFVLMFSILSTQAQVCGTLSDLNGTRLKRNLKESLSQFNHKDGLIDYVPIQFIIVNRNDGTGGIPEERIFESLCLTNRLFASLEIQFYINDVFIELNSTSIFSQSTNNSGFVQALYDQNKVTNAINVFVGGELASGNSAYYSGGSDVIYMDKMYINNKDVILAHELGHFFSLRHTFWGWEQTDYDINNATPTAVFIGNTSHEVEYVDRNLNCAEAADLICDTPADYIRDWGGGCNYLGGAVDPIGVLLDPDERNLMAYYSFASCDQYYFSETQKSVILSDLNSRVALRDLEPNVLNPVLETVKLTSPLQGSSVFYDDVNLTWNPVENAEFYYIELSRLPSFGVIHEVLISDVNYVNISGLLMDRTYHWRVAPFNAIDFCSFEPSDQWSFITSETTSYNVLANQGKVYVYPNPCNGDKLSVKSNAKDEIISWQILDVTGKVCLSSSFSQSALPLSQSINVSGLETGLYIFSTRTKEFSIQQKFIIQ